MIEREIRRKIETANGRTKEREKGKIEMGH